MCICEDQGSKGHVVGKYLLADPDKKLETTQNLKTINGENALAWFAKQGAGKGCHKDDPQRGIRCPLLGDELVFETTESGQWTVNNLWDAPKKEDGTYDTDSINYPSPIAYGEEPQGDYYPACRAD